MRSFLPTQVIADFEETPAAAVRSVFSGDVTVSACWFNLDQALVKRMEKVGLTDTYANEESTQVVVRCLLALPLLPVDDIELTFQVVADTLSLQQLQQLLR